VHKATIIPRGRALGMVMQLARRRPLLDELQVDDFAPGHHDGRAHRRGTEVRQGEHHLRRFVRYRAGNQAGARDGHQWGFSDKLGQVAYGENQQEVFLGHSVAQQKNISEDTAQIIDMEVRRLIDEAYDEAREILTEKKKDWITPSPKGCSNTRRCPATRSRR
jgi:cell division protease FtsH